MKKIIKLGIIFAVTLAVTSTVSFIKPTKSKADAAYLVGVAPKTSLDINALSKLGYQLNAPAQPAAVSSDVAVKNAGVIYPGLKNNKTYSVEYQVLTLSGFNAFSQEALDKDPVLKVKKAIDHLPVYIITYKNMYVPVFGNIASSTYRDPDPSVPKGYSKGEYNVVVDASSGVPLLAFSYR